MKYPFAALWFAVFVMSAASACAWAGFDADSIDLVEIESEEIPGKGETIDIKNQDTGTTNTCIVQSIKHNKSTIEIVVLYPDNSLHTLVMEGR